MKVTDQMESLRLAGMNRCWQSLIETRQNTTLALSDGLELLLQAETQYRQNNRLNRLQKNACFRYQASLEEISFAQGRGLNKSVVLGLSDCSFIDRGESVLISGPTGAGKSFLASAYGHQACAMGYKTMYFNTQKLLLKLKMHRADGTIFKFMDKLNKHQLLILDDFGLMALDAQQRLDLMEIVEERHAKLSTIIASQLPLASWHEMIGDETIADAIMDRLIHQGHRIEIKGESMRKKL
jgi:DNA replication protein DnaC